MKIKAVDKTSLYDKLFGLIGNAGNKPIYFQTRFGIHTFFMSEKIAVFVLDDNFIVQKKVIITPWKMLFWNPKYKHVIEIPIKNKVYEEIKLKEKIILELM